MSIDSFDFDLYKKHRTLTPAAPKSTLELTGHHFSLLCVAFFGLSGHLIKLASFVYYFPFSLYVLIVRGEGGGSTPYNGLNREASPKRGIFFRLEVGILQG